VRTPQTPGDPEMVPYPGSEDIDTQRRQDLVISNTDNLAVPAVRTAFLQEETWAVCGRRHCECGLRWCVRCVSGLRTPRGLDVVQPKEPHDADH
jgi:hypothetical protein